MTKTPLIAAGAVLGAGLILSGCGLQHIASPTKEETKTYDVTGTLGVLHVKSGSGTIVVSESSRSSVKVVETMHWKGDKPVTRHPVDGGTLLLDYNCGENDWGCGVDYRVEVPRGLRVNADSGSGDITLRALSGEVHAKAGSGAIDANGLGGKRAIAETGSGDVELRFTTTPDDVKVGTGSGTGAVWVPQGTYHVTTSTGSGSRQVEVTTDESAPRRIVVKTGSGDAKVLKV
ncbi:DUF4097 family beta strand repeat-containing protein [Sphaerisporangium sp. TRM90804]|uniref:DUF4097 family beta strand repeat-containing protein n=1 Tax=Sphaerisporangium sp. TRM90804 TaxID=3031113 RepID=UPI00244C33E6|nr:DUF4097 family beta strand repeat-containing protein [Sphaerisporangium sp. TRM90804]MDH2425125.1 DUF4097 family beta strand repeat-containing protein [Sphaerisporangium sp. TRM90804]